MKKACIIKKKGFTLVELLAVLVVIAILSVIAIPVITNVIDKARKESYKRSVEAYARAAENVIAIWAVENPNKEYSTDENTYKPHIEIKGDKVECEEFVVDAKTGNLFLDWCTTEKSRMKNPNIAYKYENGKLSKAGYLKYNIGDTFTFGDSIYYVINDSGEKEKTVTALKGNALTSTEITNLGFTPTSINRNYGMVYYDNTESKSSDYDQSYVKQIVNTWVATLPEGVQEARLIKFEELQNNLGYDETTKVGSYYQVNSLKTPSWVYDSSYWYWTMSKYRNSTSDVWCVCSNGSVDGIRVSNAGSYIAIRPVITVLKSEITKN